MKHYTIYAQIINKHILTTEPQAQIYYFITNMVKYKTIKGQFQLQTHNNDIFSRKRITFFPKILAYLLEYFHTFAMSSFIIK